MSFDTPAERLRIAIEMSDLGEQMARARLKREQPDLDEAGLDAAIVAWRAYRPGAPFGDYPGPASSRDLGLPS